MKSLKITSIFLAMMMCLALFVNQASAGGGRDFYYKTHQTHPHGHYHGGGHSEIYHHQHIPGHHHHGYHHGHGQ